MVLDYSSEGLKLFFGYLYSRMFLFTVTSSYRTETMNAIAGGVSNSQHMTGEAMDFKPYGRTTYNQILTFVMDMRDFIDFDQFIIYPAFFHISFKHEGKNRRMVIDKRKEK